ncbi:MAG: SDR family NAD(P)-dependent oxidoreductase, partial [Candidatus Eremiobacteraeota bacterium]|nr:SDR family NAD(P)-dependent oxidoreductase [Candidatus Eremiobacteraeota bacterium]
MSRRVLVTGCSSGIGQATAVRLAGAGYTVYATARKLADLEACQQAGCRCLTLDVTDEDSMVAAVEAVEGGVEVLVNNAGYSLSGALEELELAAVRRQFETNVFGLLRLTQLVLPGMREAGWGRIINISSMGGEFTFPGGGAYHATKHAVEALSDALRFEVAGFGIKVVVIQPGLIFTEFSDQVASQMEADPPPGPYQKFQKAVREITQSAYTTGPMARFGGPPEAVAAVIEKAIRAKKPRTRYPVTASAHMMILTRSL